MALGKRRAGRTDRARVTEVETHGIERIPEEDRNATALDLFRVSFGGANTFATAFLGAFPILFGLSFWQGFAATVAGLTVGALLLAPMAVFGPTNGTNNAVSSSAHLGVHGRIVGSFLSLLTATAFFSISVWSSGDALVGGLNRLVGVPQEMGSFAVAYGIFGILVLIVCIFGFRFMLLVNKIAVTAATLLFIVGFIAFWGDLNLDFVGSFGTGLDGMGMAGFIPAFIGAALIVMSNPISFGAFLGDWARYIPTNTPKRKVMGAALLAQLATLVPFTFGLATASIIATKAPEFMDPAAPNYVGGLLAVSPAWYFVPLCLIALIGGMSTGATSLYGTGLDFSSVFPRFSRVQATLFIGVLAIIFIFVGRFGFNLVQSISTFATLIVTCTAPWMVVMIIGFIVRRGWYDADALQVLIVDKLVAGTGSTMAGTCAACCPGSLVQRWVSALSTCRASSRAPWATWRVEWISAFLRRSFWRPSCTWECCGFSRSREPSSQRPGHVGFQVPIPRSPRSSELTEKLLTRNGVTPPVQLQWTAPWPVLMKWRLNHEVAGSQRPIAHGYACLSRRSGSPH